jgi:hypothetical protein
MGAGYTPPPALNGRHSSRHTLTSPSSGGVGPRAQLEEPTSTATCSSVVSENINPAQVKNEG